MTAHRELLASYVPVLIQRRLANDPQPVNSARLERLPASVLFADLSGFTPLTERLAQEGPAGAEELSSVVNAYFERMVDLIFAHGGDVIKFAGDATLAVWTDSDEENPDERLKALVLRAACCALEIQEKLNGYQVANDIRLHVKVGIGAGDIVVMHLGGVRDRWEILVAGDPLAQVGHAEKDARSGEVVLSPQAWQYVASCCQACLSPAGYAHLEKITAKLEPKPTTFPHLGSEADDALLGYIPGAIRSRLAAGHLRWLAELRRVSVLFVNLPGLDQTASDALAAMQHCIQSLQTAIYRYEGAINKLNVDDKGITLVAVLGLPPLTHEDDTIRAVHVALAIEKELQASHLPYAIGLATGRVYCGEIGGQKRREYTIMGDIVNLAARLMQAATNRILCDGTTQQAARARFQFERLPKLHVKGKAEAVEVFRPIEDIQSKEKHSPLVGRVVEKAQLEKALDALQNGQGGVVLIEGEAGMGKSRLLADLIDKAQRRQVSCLVGVADITERKRAYSAWRPILARVLEIDIRQETAVQRENVLRRLQKDELLLQWAPLLNDILPLDIPETPITREMKGQVRADNTHELMLRLLLQVRERGPLLIALEDAHWLDSASWALVLLVRQRLPDALLVLALRPMPEAAPAEFRELTRDNSLARIQLEALPGDDLRSFLCQRLGVDEVPAEVARLIEEKAHGNPFFSEELVYALRDAGWIEIEERTCRLRPDVKLEELELPDSVQGVITSRLDRLPPGLQMTWKVASVIGRVFACRLLNDIFPLADDRPKLSHYLQELEKLHVTMMETAEPELAYQFKHIILQEVAYNLMLFAHRQPLHRMIAEWYEQHFASDLAGYFPLLAFHWDRAGDVAKSLEYHEKAGEQALRNGVYREAVGFLREALRLLTPEEQSQPKSRHTPGGRVIQPSRLSQVMATSQAKEAAPTAIERDALRIGRCQRQLGEAYLGLGRLSESRHHLERAVAILGWPMPTTPARSYLRIGTQILQQLLYRLWPGPIATRSEAKRRAALEATRAFERLSEIYYLQNDKICLVNALLHSGNLAERVGPSPELAQAYASLAMTAALVPIHFLARLYRDRASDTARRIGQLSSIAWVLELSGLYGIGIGDWSRMHTDLNEAISIFEKLGDQPHRGECLAVKAQAKYMEGDFQEGLRLWREVFHSAQTRGDFLQVAWGMNGQAEAALIRGQTEQAIDFLESAARLFADNIDRVSEVSTRGMLAVAYRRLGDSRRAIDAAVQAQRLIEETGSPTGYYLLGGTADVAHVFLTLLEEGDHSLFEPARKAVAALWRYARVFRIGKPRACLQQGILYWITGRKTRAKLLWNKGLEWASRLAMPYDEGLIYARLARCSAGTEQEHYNHRASEIFSRLGAERDLRKLLISPTTVD